METMRKDGLHQELTIAQSEALRMLGTRDPEGTTMRDIADGLKITPPSATALIEEMEKKKMILREKHPTDRRIVFIRLTKKSRDLLARVCERKRRILDEMFAKISEKDRQSLERIIRSIITK